MAARRCKLIKKIDNIHNFFGEIPIYECRDQLCLIVKGEPQSLMHEIKPIFCAQPLVRLFCSQCPSQKTVLGGIFIG